MPRRVFQAAVLIALAALLIPVAPVFAQQGTTIAISSRTLRIDDLLQHGQQLEQQNGRPGARTNTPA